MSNGKEQAFVRTVRERSHRLYRIAILSICFTLSPLSDVIIRLMFSSFLFWSQMKQSRRAYRPAGLVRSTGLFYSPDSAERIQYGSYMSDYHIP